MINFLTFLKKAFPIYKITIIKNEINIILNHVFILNFMYFIKNHETSRFDILVDICGVDYISIKNRFEVVYHLLSLTYNQRLRVKVYLDEINSIESVSSVFYNAVWWEREVWDLFGIFFFNHPDLRRILTDYGFEGYPFRKDFPLSGFFEVRYDDSKKIIIQENIELSQEFRSYRYLSPWV